MGVEQTGEQSQEDSDKAVFRYIAETGNLMRMRRSHDRFLGNTFDTVASHAHHVSVTAYCLTRMEGESHEEGLRAMAMGTLHDNAEGRTGDFNYVEKQYGQTDEPRATRDQLRGLPFADDLHQIVDEYEDRETLAAKCAKDADILDQLYQEWVLTHMGNKMAEDWFEGFKRHRLPFLRTDSAKRLARLFYDATPNDWWHDQFAGDNVNLEILNGKK